MENTKICSKCDRELPLECFSKNKTRKDGLNAWCKECQKQYKAKWDAEHADYFKQWITEHAEERKQYNKQWRDEHKEDKAKYYAEWYASIEGYAYIVRRNNLQADRKYGRCGKDEDPLPPLEYYIEKFSEGIDYYDGKKYPFNELGFDRIDNSKPHTIDNMVVAVTEHNIDRWNKRMTVEEYREYMRKEKDEFDLVLN